jgi:hypothetical protein
MGKSFCFGIVFIVSLAGCGGGGGGGGGGVTGHALVVKSTTPGARRLPAFHALLDLVPSLPPTERAGDGRYDLTPDQAKVTLVNIGLMDSTGNAGNTLINLTNCTPTYSRSAATGTQLLDCPFTAPAGTYYGVNIGIATASQVLFDDAAHGFVSTPTGMTSTGTGQFLDFTPVGPGGGSYFTVGGPFNQSFKFGTDTGASTNVYINTDFVHTVFANINTGAITLETTLPIPPVSLLASVGAPATEQFYTSTGTAGNVLECTNPCTNDDNYSVRVTFPPSSTQPNYLFGPSYGQVVPVDPATSPIYPDHCKRGGYLGYDSTKQLICWAMPADCTFASYTKLCEMGVTHTPGSTVTVNCQTMASVPAPVSGATYASGCPTITPNETKVLTLVAQ